MAGNARFHNKFHRRNHHSIPSTGYPDSGTDPIASQDEPFLGDFYLGGSLSANGSAKIDGNLLVVGNLSALGEFSYIDTVVSVTSALSVVNTGTGPALTVWQYGDQPIARFIDKNDSCTLLLEDDGRISMNTCNMEPGIGLSINLNISATRSLTANASPGIYHYLVGSVAEGHAYAVGLDSHAEGVSSRSLGNFSHAEGLSALTLTQATASHAEGQQTITLGVASHAEGQNTRSNGTAAHAEGIFTLAEGGGSHAEGYFSHARGTYAHSEGALTSAWGLFGSHAEGFNTRAAGDHSHAEGISTVATGSASHTEGNATSASNLFSHAEGRLTLASGAYAHAEGDTSTSSGVASHAEGYFTIASQTGAHAEGIQSKALNVGAHAQGSETVASGQNSHAEGAYNTARGGQSHAQGLYNSASGTNSFASGRNSIAYGETSFVMGTESNAINRHSIALGFLANAAHQESLVYSNYCNYYGSSSFADNTFNVFASGGTFLLDPTTVGDPASAVKLIVDGQGFVGINVTHPNNQLTIYGNTSAQGTLTATSPNYYAYTNLRGLSGACVDPQFNLIQGRLAINTVPTSSYALHIRGGNIRVDGVDYSTVQNITSLDTDGQSLFDLRSGTPASNYSLSIASSGLGNFMKFFGGRQGDDKPFINVVSGAPLRFGTFGTFYGTSYEEHMRIGRTGNVGIHTNHPWVPNQYDNSAGEALTVNGNISAYGTVITNVLSSRSINLVHITAADGEDPFIRIGETDNTSGNAGFSGVFISYNESTNVFGISSQFASGPGLPAISIDRFGKVGIYTNTPNEALTVFGNISASGSVTALSSNVGIVVTDKTTSYTFTNDDNNRVVHFDTATQSLCAIFPSSLRTDFNCAVMNTGTNVLTLSTYTTLRAISPNISAQYGAAFVYKDSSNNIYAVGRL